MKALLLLLTLNVAFAGEILLTKSSHSGFVMRDYAGFEKCEIVTTSTKDEYKIIKKIRRGIMSSNQEFTIHIEGLKGAIKRAATETQQIDRATICDNPTTTVKINNQGTEKYLYSTGSCGSESVKTQGPYSMHLMELIGDYCKTTFEF